MGVIQKQSIRSTVVISAGFIIGAFNLLLLQPKILSPNEFGLTRMITETGTTVATMCTFGCLAVVYKFFPFYKSRLPSSKNDLPFITLMVCLTGFLLVCIGGYLLKDVIVRKFSARSPLFVEYRYLVYPFSFCLLIFMWLESFSWSLKKGVISNTLKETVARIFFTIILALFALKMIRINAFFLLFSLTYLLPSLILFFILRNSGELLFNATVSTVTRRHKGKMINFGLFLFGAQFLNLLSRTTDTFIVAAKSSGGLRDTGVLSIATYVVTLMEIPQRSISSVTIPVLAESWKNKDLNNIRHVYTKSVNNLLVIGLAMFCILSMNIHNMAAFLGKNYSGIEQVVMVIGIGKLIDLGTGANAQIISTSSYWKTDFLTNVIYTLVALPLNYILIAKYGLMGAAYSSLISLTFYNLMRFGFLWYIFKLQPYNIKDLFAVCIAVVAGAISYYIPRDPMIVLDAIIRSSVFLLLFVPAIYYARISEEMNQLLLKYLKILGFNRR